MHTSVPTRTEYGLYRTTQAAKAERKQGLFECGYEEVCWLETLRREAALVAV